jgi:hypothetical protein
MKTPRYLPSLAITSYNLPLTCVLFSLNLLCVTSLQSFLQDVQLLGQEPVSNAVNRMKVLGMGGV